MFTMQSTTILGKHATKTMRRALMLAIIPATFASTQLLAQQQPVNSAAVAAQTENNAAVAATQENVNNLVDQTQELANEYAQALAELDSLNKYNDQLQKQVDAQEAEKASIQTQLTEIETTNREVLPLMERMVATLDQFVKADIPFFLEAYQIELEYGRTLSAYEGSLGEGASARTVQFVQLGRVALMYQTLDGSETGYWDASAKQWVQSPEYADNVAQALSVARAEGAPELLNVPVPAPKQAN